MYFINVLRTNYLISEWFRLKVRKCLMGLSTVHEQITNRAENECRLNILKLGTDRIKTKFIQMNASSHLVFYSFNY